MNYKLPIQGDGTSGNHRRVVPLNGVQSWTDNGDGTADVTLKPKLKSRLRSFSFDAADALNGGSSWEELTALQPDGMPLTLVKQNLVHAVKHKFSEFNTVPQGEIVSHDNGTVEGLWEAQVDTSAEPSKDSGDWSIVFEITI